MSKRYNYFTNSAIAFNNFPKPYKCFITYI
jgi:hypothetical protein